MSENESTLFYPLVDKNGKPQSFPLDYGIYELQKDDALAKVQLNGEKLHPNYRTLIATLLENKSFQGFFNSLERRTKIPVELYNFFVSYLKAEAKSSPKVRRELKWSVPEEFLPVFIEELYDSIRIGFHPDQEDAQSYYRKLLFQEEAFCEQVSDILWEQEFTARCKILHELFCEKCLSTHRFDGFAKLIRDLDYSIGFYSLLKKDIQEGKIKCDIDTEGVNSSSLEGFLSGFPARVSRSVRFPACDLATKTPGLVLENISIPNPAGGISYQLNDALRRSKKANREYLKKIRSQTRTSYLESLNQYVKKSHFQKQWEALLRYTEPIHTMKPQDLRERLAEATRLQFQCIWRNLRAMDEVDFYGLHTIDAYDSIIAQIADVMAHHFLRINSCEIRNLRESNYFHSYYYPSLQTYRATWMEIDIPFKAGVEQDLKKTVESYMGGSLSEWMALVSYNSSLDTVEEIMAFLIHEQKKAAENMDILLPWDVSPEILAKEWYIIRMLPVQEIKFHEFPDAPSERPFEFNGSLLHGALFLSKLNMQFEDALKDGQHFLEQYFSSMGPYRKMKT